MAQEDLEALLTHMSSIAEAVNAFNSEAVQHEEFSALIAAFEGRPHKGPQRSAAPSSEHLSDLPAAELAGGGKPTPRASRKLTREARVEWKMVRDLDLNPAGKQSFGDFVTAKNPRSNEEKYVLAVYYMSEILELQTISIDHIGTTFRLTKSWKEPIDLAAGLRMTASRKGTLDTQKQDDIKVTPAGRNLVEHQLPATKAKQ